LINLWRTEDLLFEIYDIDGLWVTVKELADGIKKVIPAAEITFKPVEDVHVQQVLTGVKEQKEKSKNGLRGKRLLDEISMRSCKNMSQEVKEKNEYQNNTHFPSTFFILLKLLLLVCLVLNSLLVQVFCNLFYLVKSTSQ